MGSSELLVRRSYPHMMDSLKGQWVRDSADNYDKLLKELAVNWLLRTAAQASTPVMEITEEDGEWSIKSSTTLKTVELKFKLGEKFEETTPDGREVESLSKMENWSSSKPPRKLDRRAPRLSENLTGTV